MTKNSKLAIAIFVMMAMVISTNFTDASGGKVISSGGSGTPGGADTQVQFNNAGAFGGDADFIWSGGNLLTMGTGDATTRILLPISNDAVTPTLGFGDGDSGLFESTDDVLQVTLGGEAKFGFSGETFLGATTSPTLALINETVSGTNPGLGLSTDNNSGIGFNAVSQLSLIASSTEMMRLTNTGSTDATQQIIIDPAGGLVGADATPALAFGDGDTGFRESADDTLVLDFAGANKYNFTAGFITSTGIGWTLLNETTSATNPVFTMNGDGDTGLGANAADQLSLIASSTEMIRLTNSGSASSTMQTIISPGALMGSAATPSLAFGDGNTGFYEISDNNLQFVANGAAQFGFTIGSIVASNVAGGGIVNEATSATNPVVLGKRNDFASGIGANATSQLSLIASSTEMIRLTNTGSTDDTQQLIIDPGGLAGAVGTPALAFGDGDTGLYEVIDDFLDVAAAGVIVGRFSSTGFTVNGNSAIGGKMMNEVTSATNPVFTAKQGDDTGIGSNANDQLSLIASSTEIMRLTNTGSTDATQQLIIDPAGNIVGAAATPALAFGDGDSGFYETQDDAMGWSVAGTLRGGNNSVGLFSGLGTNGYAYLAHSDATDVIPNHTFIGDTNTGIGQNAVDQLSLISSSTEMIRLIGPQTGETLNNSPAFVVDGTGQVGVGTTTPDALFHVYNATATSTAYIESGGAGLGGQIILEDDDGAGCTKITALNGALTAAIISCP